VRGVREFLLARHAVMNALDAAPLTTIAAVHGVILAVGLSWRWSATLLLRIGWRALFRSCAWTDSGIRWDSASEAGFRECRRRDLLLTGRSFNVMKAQQIGLVSQIASEGESLRLARATAAQVGKFDRRLDCGQGVCEADPV